VQQLLAARVRADVEWGVSTLVLALGIYPHTHEQFDDFVVVDGGCEVDQIVVHLVSDGHEVAMFIAEQPSNQEQVEAVEGALEDGPLDAIHLVGGSFGLLERVGKRVLSLLPLVDLVLVEGVVEPFAVLIVFLHLLEQQFEYFLVAHVAGVVEEIPVVLGVFVEHFGPPVQRHSDFVVGVVSDGTN